MIHFKRILSIFSLTMKEISLRSQTDDPSSHSVKERCSRQGMFNFIYSVSQPLEFLCWPRQAQLKCYGLNMSKQCLELIEWAEKIQHLIIESIAVSPGENLFPLGSGGNERGMGKMKLRS